MSTIANLKNFIRHGKQARDNKGSPQPQDQPSTQVSNVHAQQQRGYQNYGGGHQPAVGHSEPQIQDHKPLQGHHAHHADFSAPVVDGRNVAAQAGHAAGAAADRKEKRDRKKDDVDSSVLERIVAEEREQKGKLPKYPGLERYTLVEKMGDGAFSNVYRAKDNTHQYEQVAIKVVRKFEMNSTQASLHPDFEKKQPKTVEVRRLIPYTPLTDHVHSNAALT
ncbi:hypothetical protein K431DRAFT_23688 [Polychaeton citri CBS 116435]|uniref:Protein kinase domain-containing protein n=1 Tax=Polychaeton citri CBS 116435 TaxID=1314669 RepID=A0A9P4QEM7_9PEZI|nr:hypothetical protein K431DRAFT_23688 [Polychaeton citri CBS 116435]